MRKRTKTDAEIEAMLFQGGASLQQQDLQRLKSSQLELDALEARNGTGRFGARERARAQVGVVVELAKQLARRVIRRDN